MIDTHCHLTFPQLADDLASVLTRARDADVNRMITVATTPEDSRQAADLAAQHDEVFATTGVHPHYADRYRDRAQLIDALHSMIKRPYVVAIGEMGLDHHYPDPPIEDQRRVFQWQLEFASQLPHPIIIHNREATDDTLAMIRDSGIPGDRFVFHCFTGSQTELDAILESGAMASFTGVVTFKNSKALADCLPHTPLDRMMIETDAPYLTPEPHRKVRPNEPCHVVHVAKFIANHLGMDQTDLIETLDRNAQRFFRLTE